MSKEQMLSSALYYSGLVDAAKSSSQSASSALTSAREKIFDEWQSDSGLAMINALDNLHSRINAVSIRLEALSGQMTSHAWSIYNNWPEENPLIPKGGGGGGGR